MREVYPDATRVPPQEVAKSGTEPGSNVRPAASRESEPVQIAPAVAPMAPPAVYNNSPTPLTAPSSQLGPEPSSALSPASEASCTEAEQIQYVVTMLRGSDRPDLREWAADWLAAVDCRTNPQVVQTLVKVAREDSVPFVRVACVRCLAKMNVNSFPVACALRDLKGDADLRVRYEAVQALRRLAPNQAVVTGQPVQSVGTPLPAGRN